MIIQELGEEHQRTGKWIVYTSADSVFQIAAHEETVPLEELYEACKIARDVLTGKHAVGRVIARPFTGEPGSYERTPNRHDYSLVPRRPNYLSLVRDAGVKVHGVGKISDIFAAQGVTRLVKGPDNMALFDRLLEVADEAPSKSLSFVNFVDFDMHFGHRRDVAGYSNALHELDARLPEFMAKLKDGDLVVITADHGCDPTAPGSDHTREHIPMIFFGPNVAAQELPIANTFSDIGATLAKHLGVKPLSNGTALL